MFNGQSELLSSCSKVVDLYLETTCSGSISGSAYESLICLEASADKIDQKLIQHLKRRILQGSIAVINSAA
ncbi:hypothetical protein SynBIOSE41_03896 [Synechococcus sp. BIOS-E4-1]|nr:hypothetical protein SynBIOSE41_03896 [Synechococcus sp. BIOS-E4-1]